MKIRLFFLLLLSIASLTVWEVFAWCSFNWLSLSSGQTATWYQYSNIDYGLPYTCQTLLTGYEVFQCQNNTLVWLSGGRYWNYTYSTCVNNAPRSCVFWARFGQQIVIPHMNVPFYPSGINTSGIIANNQIYQSPLIWNYVFKWYRNDIVDASTDCDNPALSFPGWILSYDTGANTTLLYCDNGQIKDFIASSVFCRLYDRSNPWASCGSSQISWFSYTIDPGYIYNTCQNRPPRNCQLWNTIIEHGDSVTTFNRADSRIGWTCLSEVRTCTDGTLSWSLTYLSCRSYAWSCGTSNGSSFTAEPTVNLCAAGTPSSISYNIINKQWNWSCLGDGWSSPSCSASWTGTISQWICNDFPNGSSFLSANNEWLCKAWTVNNFSSTDFGWTWRCGTSQWNSFMCESKKTVYPTARIEYSTTSPTNNSVTAYVLDLQPYGTVVQNNNGHTTRVFQTNGTYEFILKFDNKITYLTAKVDRINTRPLTLADLSQSYQSKKCPRYKNLPVAKWSYNLLDMQTMANNCLLTMTKRTSWWTTNPKKLLTRKELIELSYAFANTIRNYTDLPRSRSDQYSYVSLPRTNNFSYIVWWFSAIGWRKTVTHTESNKRITASRNKTVTPKEVYETIASILSSHEDTTAHRQSLWQERDWSKKKSMTYAEYAYLMRRLLEGYDRIPVGTNDVVLYNVYQRVKDKSIADQKKTIEEMTIALKNISPDKAEALGLSLWRLLDDISSVYNNTIPKRKWVTSISIQQVQELAERQTSPSTLFYRIDEAIGWNFLEMSY